LANKICPDERGHFGPYGGLFVAETLIPAVEELDQAYQKYMTDPEFMAELDMDFQRKQHILNPGARRQWQLLHHAVQHRFQR
jgi:tryptophan synthase beta subunit